METLYKPPRAKTLVTSSRIDSVILPLAQNGSDSNDFSTYHHDDKRIEEGYRFTKGVVKSGDTR